MKAFRRHHGLVNPGPHKIDLWLQRASGVAQVLLSFVTLGTLYFTVVPLYQKAALEESVARLEGEIRKLSVIQEESYSQFRNLAVREFVSYAGAECSGLLIPPPLPGVRSSQAEGHDHDALGIEARSCLMRNLKAAKSLGSLKPQDFDRLSERALSLAAELDADRLQLMKEYDGIPNTITDLESRKIPLKGYSGEWDKIMEKIEVREFGAGGRDILRHRAVVQQLQLDVVSSYIKKVQNGLLKIRQMDWK